MKKVRTAAVVAVVTTAVTRARDYAREHPDQAAQTLDRVEEFVRGKAAPKHAGYIDKGSAALRQGLGLPPRATVPSSATSATSATSAGLEDPDPDTSEPPAHHGPSDPVAPNPAPGTSDDPQPRRRDDEPAPLTPGERPHH